MAKWRLKAFDSPPLVEYNIRTQVAVALLQCIIAPASTGPQVANGGASSTGMVLDRGVDGAVGEYNRAG